MRCLYIPLGKNGKLAEPQNYKHENNILKISVDGLN